MTLEELIEKHEGYRQYPYKDSVGVLTIGIGRNLEAVGIRHSEARYLLRQDILVARFHLLKLVPLLNQLDEVRQAVLISMCFNLGAAGLGRFKKMLEAVGLKQWGRSAEEMLDSRWATQVGRRADELAKMMRTGEWE